MIGDGRCTYVVKDSVSLTILVAALDWVHTPTLLMMYATLKVVALISSTPIYLMFVEFKTFRVV